MTTWSAKKDSQSGRPCANILGRSINDKRNAMMASSTDPSLIMPPSSSSATATTTATVVSTMKSPPPPPSLPQITLMIENPSKGKNWGPLLRCAAAFGISQIVVVGYNQCSVEGSHGASRHVHLQAFTTHQAALDWLTQQGFDVRLGLLLRGSDGATMTKAVGDHDVQYATIIRQEAVEPNGISRSFVQIDGTGTSTTVDTNAAVLPRSFPVHARRFAPRTCLMVDKSSKGLPWSLAQHCTSFIHVPHFGIPHASCTAPAEAAIGQSADRSHPALRQHANLLAMEACLSIVLYEFTVWAGYNDSNYRGQKYQVDQVCKGQLSMAERQEKQEKRKRQWEDQQNERDEAATGEASKAVALFFGGENHDGDY